MSSISDPIQPMAERPTIDTNKPTNVPKSGMLVNTIKDQKTNSISDKILRNQYWNTYKAIHLGGKETPESKMIQSAFAFSPTHSLEETTHRHSNYKCVSSFLNNLTNEELSELLEKAKPLGSGMGGEVSSIIVHGIPVFVKKIRLTDIERANPKSTQNLFELPTYYQYGIGSLGFGVWREIAAHEMTTQWVLNEECQNFPLMYHFRMLERSPITSEPLTKEQFDERQRYIDYWDGSSSVGKRAESAVVATADVVVFMENIPYTLDKWLSMEGSYSDLPRVERELGLVTAFMKSKGFLHFDAHFHNILANNHHIYFGDFGLAMSRAFDLSKDERSFLEKHIDYDRYYVLSELAARALLSTLRDEEKDAALDTYHSSKEMTIALPSSIDSILKKYRHIAVLMDSFFRGLREHSKSTPYPEAELAHEWKNIT